MRKIVLFAILLTLLCKSSIAAETVLPCKFMWGDKITQGKGNTKYNKGDRPDIYLKIDFDKEKVIESPFSVYGTFGISNTNIIFSSSEVSWVGKNKYVEIAAILDRESGKLRSVYNISDTFRASGEENYQCSKAKLKF